MPTERLWGRAGAAAPGVGSHLAATGAPTRPWQDHGATSQRQPRRGSSRAQPIAAPLTWVPIGRRAVPPSPAPAPPEKVSHPGVQAEHTPRPEAPKIQVPHHGAPDPTSGEAAEPTFHGELGLLVGWPGPGPAGAHSGHGITPVWKQREKTPLSTTPTMWRKPGLHWGPRSALLSSNVAQP